MILLAKSADNWNEMQTRLKKIFFLTLLGVSALPVAAFCQVDTAWVRRYNGPADSADEAHAIAIDDSGNVYVTGWSFGGVVTGWDYATIKYDRNGNQLWLKRYNGSANKTDYSADIALDGRGNVCVAGSSENPVTDDYATVKYDSKGNEQWIALHDGPINGVDGARALTIDPDGNIYVVGVSESTNVGGVCGPTHYFDYVTLKYDSNGNRLWAARYSNPPDYENFACFVGVDKGGNVYVSGYCYNWCLNQLEWVTVKYDSIGTQQWVQRMNAGLPPLVRSNTPTDMKLDASGNIYLTGGTVDSITFLDYTTIKYDPQGNQLWKARFNGSADGYDFCRAMALDSQGNAYVTGYSDAGVERHIVTIKYDSNGNELWVQPYNAPGSGGDVGMDISADSAENVYVAGIRIGSNSTNNYVILKYDSNGNLLWEKRYERPIFNRSTEKLSVDRSGNLYLSGTDNQNAHDYVTIKYSPLPQIRGDLNLDGVLTLADVVLAINMVFLGEATPAAPTACDFNCDGLLTGVDVVILLRMFYLGAPAPC